MQKYLSFIMYNGSALLLFTRKLHCLQHFDRSLHVDHWTVSLTVFEIQGFKMKNKNDNDDDKKNWRNRLFAISPMFVVQFSPNISCTYILTLAIILWCQKWIISESESVNSKFQMCRHNGQRSRPSLYTKYYRTL